MQSNYIYKIKKEIYKLDKTNVNKKVVDRFLKQLSMTDKITKETNPDIHFCAFFVPINKKSQSIYLGHHIKADDWIPPGGHIKLGEHPVDTVIREFKEELDYEVGKNQIKIFNLTIKDVSGNPRSPCKLHFDIWYLVDVPKVKYNFLRKEFYDAYWHNLDSETYKKIKTKKYNQIVRLIGDIL